MLGLSVSVLLHTAVAAALWWHTPESKQFKPAVQVEVQLIDQAPPFTQTNPASGAEQPPNLKAADTDETPEADTGSVARPKAAAAQATRQETQAAQPPPPQLNVKPQNQSQSQSKSAALDAARSEPSKRSEQSINDQQPSASRSAIAVEEKALSAQSNSPKNPTNPSVSDSNVPGEDSSIEPISKPQSNSKGAPQATATGSSLAAPQAKRTAEQQKAKQAYLAMISKVLGRHKSYPPAAKRLGISGVTTVSFKVQPDGRIFGAVIQSSSTNEALDNETLKLLKRVGSFAPMPKSMAQETLSLTLPINYQLRVR